MFAALFLGVVVWFSTIQPSHDRPWRPEVAVMPRAFIDGDRIRITGVRNFEYRSRDDFDVRYEEREVSLSHLNSLDFYLSYFWPDSPVAHTFVSFGFDNAPPISISIETRPEIGEGFDPIPSLFKQFELIYVVGDERDLVRVRTNYRNEDTFLYRLRTSPKLRAGSSWFTWSGSTSWLIDPSFTICSVTAARSISSAMQTSLAGSAGWISATSLMGGAIAIFIERASWIRACRLQNCASILASTTSREQRATPRISPSGFANPSRHRRADLSLPRRADRQPLRI